MVPGTAQASAEKTYNYALCTHTHTHTHTHAHTPSHNIFTHTHAHTHTNTHTHRCEAGDLAGKFGPIDGRDGMVNVTDTTGQLRLQGPISIIGRSVVIHDVDGTNFECGTIRSIRDIGSE